MPTIPLYSRAAHPDGCHRVTSPGGYEWWQFEARSVSDDRWIRARLSSGLPFDRSYVRRYLRYRRHPTRVSPPRPQEFVEARLEVFRGDVLEQRVVTRHDALVASSDEPDVTVGPNTWRDAVLSMPGLNLTFRPRVSTAIGEHELMPQSFQNSEHRWIVAGALCGVEGTFDSREFRGVGYRDHHYDSDLPALNVKQWLRGTAIGDDGGWCVAFHHAQPCDWRADAQVQLMAADESGAAGECDAESTEMSWSRPTKFLLKYLTSVRFSDVLSLTRGRAIMSSFADVKVMYDAEHRGRKGKALCTMIYPQRLRWPAW